MAKTAETLKTIGKGKGNSKTLHEFQTPGLDIPDAPKMRKTQSAPSVDDDLARLKKERDLVKRRKLMGAVGTQLTNESGNLG